MRIGGAIFVIVVGAILKFAISVKDTHGFDLNAIGLILMIAGIVWLVAEIIWASTRRRTDIVQHTPADTVHTTYAEPQDPRY